MKTIDKILEAFLQEQHNRLKERTYSDYESVIELFRTYLNSYVRITYRKMTGSSGKHNLVKIRIVLLGCLVRKN